ncbi:MAG: hypothetical protein LUC83_01040 [Clostridiales bacterium]|nr:hypothetical protein [Clostridiales bacterium]
MPDKEESDKNSKDSGKRNASFFGVRKDQILWFKLQEAQDIRGVKIRQKNRKKGVDIDENGWYYLIAVAERERHGH